MIDPAMKLILIQSGITLFIIGCILKNSFSFQPLAFTCNNYILNSYLYILFSFCVMLLAIFINDKFPFMPQQKILKIAVMIGSFVLLVSIFLLSSKFILVKHGLWILLLLAYAYLLVPLYKTHKQLFFKIGLQTISILVMFSLLAYFMKDKIQNSWGTYLRMGLFAVIVASVIELIINYFHKKKSPDTPPPKHWKWLSYVSIGLFILYTIYDTKQILTLSQQCKNPDYIKQSMDIVLDGLNLFTNLYRSQS